LSSRLQSFINGGAVANPGATTPLQSPVDLEVYAELPESGVEFVGTAVDDAGAAYCRYRSVTVADRSKWLRQAALSIEQEAAMLARLIIQDIGKPKRLAHFEVLRAAQFVRACAGQLETMGGETLPMDAVPAGAGRFGFTRRTPYGVVAAVTPFNAPINLLVQKVAPALAAGNAVVVKPHPAGTRVALAIAGIFVKAGLPAGLFDLVTGDRLAALALVADPGVTAVSFTGGSAGGNALVRAAGAKKFIAELGSNSANVVLADANLADAAKRIAAAAFEASGQQCVSAQRIIVVAEAYDTFLDLFLDAARGLRVGDPSDDATDVGPMVSMAAADRVMAMLDNAITEGGRYALEPFRDKCIVSPCIIVDAPVTSSLWRDEAFGPVAAVQRAEDSDDALRLANDSPFGLQGAVFTRSLGAAFRFAADFDVGALWVNEASRFRLDNYPFGGVKQSGFGREGIRYAIEELSQLKFVGIRSDV
jgi:acyl-CoA reductase-like NAD-dependent aldehyde dehydrogenase